MNREIKIRCYSKKMNKWRYFTLGVAWMKSQLKEYNNLCLDGERFFLSTCLKDKNGKEIYEGDIVKMICDWGDWICQITFGVKDFKGNTYASFGYIGKDAEYILASEDVCKTDTIIIGNIYENPELLNNES